jgi:hypothetical protein
MMRMGEERLVEAQQHAWLLSSLAAAHLLLMVPILVSGSLVACVLAMVVSLLLCCASHRLRRYTELLGEIYG